LANNLLGSRLKQHCCRRLLPFGAVWLVASCTLTDESFEPSYVSRVGGELSPDRANPALPASDEGEVNPLTDETNPEQNPGGAALDPGAPSGERPDVGSASETSDGEPRGDDADADAGAGPVDESSSGPDAAPFPSPPTPCSGDEFGSSCYQLFGEFVAWSIAEQRCVAWGGHLASVESPEEDEFISGWPALLGIPSADGSGVWLGGTDALIDGDFRWWDNSPLLVESWAPNQPDNGPGVDCVEKRNDGTALWYDRRCTDSLPFVCERPL